MHQKTAKRMGLALIAGAAALRFIANFGAAALPTGSPWAQEPALPQLPTVWVLKVLPRQEEALPPPEEVKTPLTFSPGQAASIELGGAAAEVDKPALLTAPFSYDASAQPGVLILHTHTSEAYTQSAGWTYEESDPLRTTQADRSVVAVGRQVAQALEARGISVIHDTTFHDHPDYNLSYRNAAQTMQTQLQQHPSIQVVLDIHRDAAAAGNGSQLRQTCTLSDGTAAAKLMLVVGTDLGAGGHPNWQQNLSLAMKVQAAAQLREPEICRPMDLRYERFNQQLFPGALLVEVGAAGNTLPEALAAAQVLGESLADLLVG